MRHRNNFSVLALRAGAGDTNAKVQLGDELEPELVHIVRRVVQKGLGRSSLECQILTEAERIGLDAHVAACADGESLVRAVARSVCSLVLASVQRRRRDSVVAEDTVCD